MILNSKRKTLIVPLILKIVSENDLFNSLDDSNQ